MPPATRSPLRLAVLAAILLWAGLSFARESWTALDRRVFHPVRGRAPIMWRYGDPQPARLDHFLRRTTGGIPAGSRVTFESPPLANAAFYRAAWVAYYLPHLEIVPSFRPEAQASDYWLIYGPAERPELELEIEDRRGKLYSVPK